MEDGLLDCRIEVGIREDARRQQRIGDALGIGIADGRSEAD